MISKETEKKIRSVVGEIIGMVIAVLCMAWLVPKFGFVETSEYELWLSIGVWSAVISGFSRVAGKTIGGRWKYLMEMIALGAGMYSTYMFVIIYPFDFGLIGHENWNQWLQLALYVAIFAMVIAMIVTFVKLVVGPSDYIKDNNKDSINS